MTMRCSRTRLAGALGMTCLVVALTAGQAVAGTQVPVGADAIPGAPPIGGPQLGTGLALNPAPGVKALPAGLTPKAWLVADLDTGQVLGAFDAHAEHRPASTLKTLAALALIPKVDPAAKITFTTDELNLTAQKDGRTTRVGLVPGTVYPAKRLFEAMLALSANDATEALAASAPGGRAATLDSMNAIAATLQARDTHAATPDGLDGPGQQTSAYDLALIARAAIAEPGFTAYDTTPLVKLPSTGHPLGGSNHDRLQNSATELGGATVIGGKDGYTTDSGQVWWGAAEKNGHRIVVTEMDAGFEPVTEEIQLLNWGFAVDGKIAPAGSLVGPVSATGAPEKLSDVAKNPPVAASPCDAPADRGGPPQRRLGRLVVAARPPHRPGGRHAGAPPPPRRPVAPDRPRHGADPPRVEGRPHPCDGYDGKGRTGRRLRHRCPRGSRACPRRAAGRAVTAATGPQAVGGAGQRPQRRAPQLLGHAARACIRDQRGGPGRGGLGGGGTGCGRSGSSPGPAAHPPLLTGAREQAGAVAGPVRPLDRRRRPLQGRAAAHRRREDHPRAHATHRRRGRPPPLTPAALSS